MTRKHILFTAIIAVLVCVLILPKNARAQTDARCWKKDKCIEQRMRAGLSKQAAAQGFVQNNQTKSVCGGDKDPSDSKPIGFCLPSTKTITNIAFGGKREFAHIGDFIQTIYRYGIIVAGILSVIVIMVGGLRIIISGGNPDRIGGGRKMIGGAIAGLVITALSYVILNSLNPATVNLRMPQVWMLNKVNLAPLYCDSVKQNTKLAKTPKNYDRNKLTTEELNKVIMEAFNGTEKDGKKIEPNIVSNQGNKKPKCGEEYFVEKAGPQTCRGLYCGKQGGRPKTCVLGENGKYECKDAILAGEIKAQDEPQCNDFSETIIDNNLQLIAICKDGTLKKLRDIDVEKSYEYAFAYSGNIKSACGKQENLAGFYLGAEVNDEACLLQLDTELTDDWHAIGQSSPNSHVCDTNLGKLAYEIKKGHSPNCEGESGVENCSCAAMSKKDDLMRLARNDSFTSHLISPEEIENGYFCNIQINRSEFPALDNNSVDSYSASILAATTFNPAAAYIINVKDKTNCFLNQ